MRFWQIPWQRCCFHVLIGHLYVSLPNVCSNLLCIFMLHSFVIDLWEFFMCDDHTYTHICTSQYTPAGHICVCSNGQIYLSDSVCKLHIMLVGHIHTYLWIIYKCVFVCKIFSPLHTCLFIFMYTLISCIYLYILT